MDNKSPDHLIYVPFAAKNGALRFTGTWHFYNDDAIGPHKGSRLRVSLKNVSLVRAHLKRQDHSGVISVSVNGVISGRHDMFCRQWEEAQLDIFESDEPKDVEIDMEVVGKNEASKGYQMHFLGVSVGYGMGFSSTGPFPWLSEETKEKILEYSGGDRALCENQMGKYFNYLILFSKLNRYMELKGASVLEVGCGAGMGTVVLRQMGARVTAGDFDRGTTLDVARRVSRDFGVDDAFRFIDVRSLDFEDETFDYVHCEQVLEHIPGKDQAKALDELCRVVKKGGYLYIDTENRLCPLDRHDSGLYFVHWLPKGPACRIAAKRGKGIKIAEMSFGDVNPVLHDYMGYFEIKRILKRRGIRLRDKFFPFVNAADYRESMHLNSRLIDALVGLFSGMGAFVLPIHFLAKKGPVDRRRIPGYIETAHTE